MKNISSKKTFFVEVVQGVWESANREAAEFIVESHTDQILREFDSLPGRDLFINVLCTQTIKDDQYNYALPNEYVYDCVCDLIHVMLNSAEKYKDIKNMKDIM